MVDGGVIYIEVPDISDLMYLPPTHDRFLSQHLWIFSKNSLSNICQQAGFKVNRIEQESTLRGRRNLVALLSVASAETKMELQKDDVNDILNIRRKFYDAGFQK